MVGRSLRIYTHTPHTHTAHREDYRRDSREKSRPSVLEPHPNFGNFDVTPYGAATYDRNFALTLP